MFSRLFSQIQYYWFQLTFKVRNYTIVQSRVARLRPQGQPKGRVLLAYLLDSFLIKPGAAFSNKHTNHWECWQIAQTFLDLGYCVDVTWFWNRDFVPKHRYDVFVGLRHAMDAIAPQLNPDCIKVLHADTAYIPFHNTAEAKRLTAIQARRGITLPARRFEAPTTALNYVDWITVLGNQFTINTYQHAHKPIHRLQISAPETYPWPDGKDFSTCRRHFLWFGSWGLVHKGLDLVLEAFAALPDYHLTVCGPIAKEPDFEHAYHRELYETDNIHTWGWVDTGSPQFLELARRCVGLVYPSSSEGGGGSVLTCMHAGLIPIVSYEASVDVSEACGVVLMESTIAEIQRAVTTIADLPAEQLEQMARAAWTFARTEHTRDRFAESYREFAQTLLATREQQPEHTAALVP